MIRDYDGSGLVFVCVKTDEWKIVVYCAERAVVPTRLEKTAQAVSQSTTNNICIGQEKSRSSFKIADEQEQSSSLRQRTGQHTSR
ncbi:hypothetical protein N7462_005351 [Penicillium macrosclerotiorum]|uniref:uncharacterized protein n=1 Tax=Penicillium macrosclerotiorum TaxID=303699 RepID=UPI002548B1D6|nr:uncharacterized protein N7462_005351 [Penicillium macrosclerotiorum]KAJ5682186.1 hypothetical protein N7462_005351 [Penicillium macrosclerotiorum]